MTEVFYDSQLSVLKITDSAGTLRDISAYVVGVTPHFGRTINDKTTLGYAHKQKKVGLNDTSLDIELLYSEDANTGSDTVLGPLLDDVTERAWEYYPHGTGGKKYYGNGLVENYQPTTKVGSLVGATCTLQATSRSRT